MADELSTLHALLADVARRRSALAWRRGFSTGAIAAALVLGTSRAILALVGPTGGSFIALTALAVTLSVAAIIVALRAARVSFTHGQLARLVEERVAGLDDVVVTAVDYAAREHHTPVMASRLAGAALRLLPDDSADRVVARSDLAGAGRAALGAGALLAVAAAFMAGPVVDAVRVAGLYVLPATQHIRVQPGDVRVRAGASVTITASVASGAERVTPSLVTGEGADSTPLPMARTADGTFAVTVPDVAASFRYLVRAGTLQSTGYTVTVLQPAAVERIDLDYAFPPALHLAPRREENGGDIYAPEGTTVRLTVTADRAVRASALVLGDGTRLPLDVTGRVSAGDLNVTADGSYRVALVEDDGVETAGDTEYFIRTLLDRPPDVRVLRPAGDREVTPLEEVLIEARADDDFGVRSFDLVLQKPGDADVVVPLRGPRDGLTANGRHLLYLEDLDVAPGDFVTYYVRASDVGRGKPSSETRSDIFFLEVKAFNDEFVAAQSQAMSAGGQSQGTQDLAAAQKELVVATWKLDSRGRRARRTGSAADIKALAAAQRAIEQRAAKEAGNQLQATAGPTRGRRGRATVDTVGNDPMGLAIEAMRRAAAELDRLQLAAALPHEKEALNQLLRAEADVRRRQVARQQSGGGGGNRTTPDLSALFDQELRKRQETNYETPAASETRQDEAQDDDPLAKLRELARRQEALGREQQDLARTQQALEAEALKRRLEKLTRDQEELRRQLEEVARSVPSPPAGGEPEAGRSAQERSEGRREGQRQAGQASGGQSQGEPQNAQGQRSGQTGGDRQSSGQGPRESERDAMRDAAADMRQAAAGLQRQDPAQASESASRAVERIRRAEEALRGSTANDLQRRRGDLQIEARQLAEAERRLTAEMTRLGTSADARARGRQVAAEQDRLAARAERLGQDVRGLARRAPEAESRGGLDRAGRELESGQAVEHMRNVSRALKEAATTPAGASPSAAETSSDAGGGQAGKAAPRPDLSAAAAMAESAARTLDRVADSLAAGRAGDTNRSASLEDPLAQANDLRQRIEAVERSLEQLRESGGRGRQGQSAREGEPGRGVQGEMSRLQQQLADDMREARGQVDSMSRAAPELRGSTPEDWQPSVSAPGTEAFKQDFTRWESLKAHLLLALEKVEQRELDALRRADAKTRMSAGASDAVPDAYRTMVEKYYRSLAAPRKPGK